MATTRIGNGLKRIALIGAVCGIAMAGLTTWLANLPPTTSCSDGGWLTSLHSNDHAIFATRVVSNFWLGRHNVFGIFVIPDQYSETEYSSTVIARGVKNYPALSERSVETHGEIVPAKPGEYVKHAHLWTRTALWDLFTGHYGDLLAPCNWAVVFTSKKT